MLHINASFTVYNHCGLLSYNQLLCHNLHSTCIKDLALVKGDPRSPTEPPTSGAIVPPELPLEVIHQCFHLNENNDDHGNNMDIFALVDTNL